MVVVDDEDAIPGNQPARLAAAITNLQSLVVKGKVCSVIQIMIEEKSERGPTLYRVAFALVDTVTETSVPYLADLKSRRVRVKPLADRLLNKHIEFKFAGVDNLF